MKKFIIFSSTIFFVVAITYLFLPNLLIIFAKNDVPEKVVILLPDKLIKAYYQKVFDGSRSTELEHEGIMSLLESDLEIEPYIEIIFEIVASNPKHVIAVSHLILADKIEPNSEMILNLKNHVENNENPNHVRIVTGLALYQSYSGDQVNQNAVRKLLEPLGVSLFPGDAKSESEQFNVP